MSERKYTDEQIVKALECCRDFGDCSLCPYENATFADELDCTEKLHTDALNLINRQKVEIEELEYDRKLIFDEGASWYAKANDLQIELDAMRGAANSYKMRYEKAKSAVEERKANAPVAEMTEGK